MTTYFISHGAPDLVLHPSEAADFMRSFGLGGHKPRAILMVSAHFLADHPMLTADPKPDMIYDFGGFDPALRQIVFTAPGAPDVAQEAVEALRAAGFSAQLEHHRGFDHGTWVQLVLMHPRADIPVVQLSVNPHAGPEWHYRLGQALAPLAGSGVLVIGSGAATHNLRELFGNYYPLEAPAPDWVKEFGEWLDERIVAGDRDALIHYRSQAPYGRENHPTEEHLLPLYVAMGAACDGAGDPVYGERIHTSHQYGVLMMDCYRFS